MMPKTMTSTIAIYSSSSPISVPLVVMINNSTFTATRLSGENMTLMSRMTINSVNNGLNETVVNCFEGTSMTESVATTTITVIDPGQFGKKINAHFSFSDSVTVNLGVGIEMGRCSQPKNTTHYTIDN